VQVATAVIQVIDLTPIRQGQRGQVAERVVLVAKRAVRGDFFGQTAEQILGVFQLFFCDPKLLADPGRLPLDAQQPVTVVVCECLARITVDLGNQTANGITLEQRMALGPLGIFAIANLIQSCEMATDVVAETPGQVIHPHFFAQPVRSVVGKAVRGVVLVDQRGQANGLVVLVANPLAHGILAAARQATGGAHQAGGLALAVGVAEHLTVDVVGEAFRGAVRVADTQHFAVGLALQRGGLVQRVCYRDQVLAFVIAVVRALARAVLVALDLGQGVPPQVLGLVGRVDDGVRQAVIAVQVLGHLAEGIEFGEQVALVVVARSPGAAVRVADLGHQCGQVVILVNGLAAQRVGFFEQAGEFVVLELQAVTVRQGQANLPLIINIYFLFTTQSE